MPDAVYNGPKPFRNADEANGFQPAQSSCTEDELIALLVWDEDEDPRAVLAPGIYQTCAGAWNREPDGRWRWWQDPNFEA